MADYIPIGVSMTARQAERLQALAEKQGTSISETTRNLINIALPFAEHGHGIDFVRLITMIELNTLVLDTLLQKASPEDADRLLDLAIEYTKKYHAA
jgi:molecular chaperone DnaK (HSP70)